VTDRRKTFAVARRLERRRGLGRVAFAGVTELSRASGCAIATSHSSDKTSPTIETAYPACASTSSTNSATALT
jgi:hypothetical protein